MKKVLVITYYWPPAGGPGVQRWLKFVKYLPEFGVEPLVYLPQNPTYPIVDPNLMDEVPRGVRLIKRRIVEPYAWASLWSKKKIGNLSSGIIKERDPSLIERCLLWLRGNLFIPDARKFWVRPSIRYLSKVIEEEGIGTVISTGPPHSLHLIGMGLKKRHNIQWIADFRDPWTSIGYHKNLRLTPYAKRKHLRLERKVLQSADKLIVTSRTTKEEFRALTDRPIKVITNGFEGEAGTPVLDREFTLSHIGSLSNGRNPLGLWRAIAELAEENKAFVDHVKIRLVGLVGEEVLQSLAEYKLDSLTEQLGYLPHDQIRGLQQNSQALLLVEIDSRETRGIVPGKLFEYLNARRPILAIGPKEWEAGSMVEQARAGVFLEHGEVEALKAVLLDWFSAYQRDALQSEALDIGMFHRRALTESLANYI